MNRILTDKDIDKLESFLAWYDISGDISDKMSLMELYNLMIEVENKKGA